MPETIATTDWYLQFTDFIGHDGLEVGSGPGLAHWLPVLALVDWDQHPVMTSFRFQSKLAAAILNNSPVVRPEPVCCGPGGFSEPPPTPEPRGQEQKG